MSDLISRCELFNRLALIHPPAEANHYAAEVYGVINQMPTVETQTETQNSNLAKDSQGFSQGDLIYRADAIKAVMNVNDYGDAIAFKIKGHCYTELELLPSARPNSLSHDYARAVWTWLLDYQIKSADLEGRYSPYEVLSWVANDWRKDNGFDK